MTDISNLLASAVARKASDLFLTAGKKPAFRIHAEVVSDPALPAVTAEEINSFRRRVIGETGELEYRTRGGYDASHTLGGQERYRLNFFSSLGGPGLAVRPILSGNDLRFQDLNLPEILAELCSAPRGLILVTGSTGCGKSTTLAAHQLSPPYSDDRRPHRIPAHRQKIIRHPAGSQRHHRRFSASLEIRPAGKPGCDRHRGNARYGDHPGRNRRLHDRAPRHLHGTHDRYDSDR